MASSSGDAALSTPREQPLPAVCEFRRIVFSNQALRSALIELERRMMFKPPPGAIVACELAERPALPAKLTFHDALVEERQVVEVDTARLAMALIHYCIKEGIPIPRTAEKYLDLADGKVSLNFALSLDGG